ncbi:MAG TPA: DUF58 domain-containing protein [Candidatus Avipropionibacterium avicola]|uniref:DUF58 domain-containing protein n=1 Tax=Candidatus Avipropionibacterium avicola TaxID=2840701 RepID=A0A9D1KNB7_9ACTN|nr:DUF58 domain-containing protein [Candidatus Avipropionibacterium avicola]
MVLTWRAGLLALLCVPVALVWGAWAWLLLLVLVLLVVVDLVACPSPRAVGLERGGDTSVRLGQQAQTWLRITNRGRRHLVGRIRNAWVPSAGASDGVRRIDIAPGQRRQYATPLDPTRRGDRAAGPVTVRTLGPLRFAGRQANHEVPWTVRVLPPFHSRKHLPSRLARLRELDGRSVLLQRGQGTEFDSLREYVPGDDVRSIEWRATARSSTVVVKTWRPERDRHVLIVLDSGRTSAGRVADQPRLDHHMDAALLLAALASKAGDRVDLLVADREVRASVERASSSELIARLVNAMAPVEAQLLETDHRLVVNEALLRVSQRSLVVLLTGLDHATVNDGWLPVMAPLLRRHRVVVASVSDPRLGELVSEVHDVSDAYAAAAAEADHDRRDRTAADLRRRGISVMQAPPQAFAPGLADHYLGLKKAGQL